ncbi:MAG: glycerophosphodiester phosphodiesterase [Acidimicrobiaceae bacterium]|nr:glycerophosphodiester phosphodiesterase [Acidimicrobiaceae bacterium]
MQQRLPSLLDTPIAFAHRGAKAYAPENTLEAFALGLKLGANGLESDVWVTTDGVPVLDHDGVVKRSLGRGTPIAGLRRSALPAHIPSLADLLDRCGSGYHLSLDLKDPQSGQAVIDVVRDAAPAMLERLWLCSPQWESLLPLRGQGARLVDSTAMQRIKEGAERRVATLAANGIDAINMHHRDWTGGTVALVHRFNRVAFGWDMQEPHILQRGLRMGLDGVYCDYPDRMMDAYRARAPWPGGSQLGVTRLGSRDGSRPEPSWEG